MHTHIAELNGWKIGQVISATKDSKFTGMFFAGRSAGNQWVGDTGNYYEAHDYIHKDGTIHRSLINLALKDGNGGELSGYFETREELEQVIRSVS